MANPKIVVGKTLYVEHDIRDSQDRPSSRTGTTWASSDNAKATVAGVNEAGANITGVAAGTVTITATNGSDSGTVQVDVIPAPVVQSRKVTVYVPRDSNKFGSDR
jgi:uncharacterized protein YjdB